VSIIKKVQESIEAKKESYGSWIAFGICLAVAAVCALAGFMIWAAEFIGGVLSCFAFAGLFLLAVGIVKFVIDAKAKKASRKLSSAKEEVKRDVAVVAKPFEIARRSAPERPFSALTIGLLTGLALLAYYLKGEETSSLSKDKTIF
jgi:hypothetical protein